MTEIIGSLGEIDPGYSALYCDLWGCLHDGVRAFPEAVAALERFRAGGGRVVLLTNSPRPAGGRDAAARHARGAAVVLGRASSPPATRRRRRWSGASSAGGSITSGRSAIWASSPTPRGGRSTSSGCRWRRRRASSAPASSTTGARRRRTIGRRSSTGKLKGLKLLCANPDIVVDVGETRIWCAGAIAAAYTAAGGRSYYFGKPHPPIYGLARRRLAELTGFEPRSDEILCLGDGIGTDILGRDGGIAGCAVRHRRDRGGGDRDHAGGRAGSGAAGGLSCGGEDGAEAGDGVSALTGGCRSPWLVGRGSLATHRPGACRPPE